MEMDGFDHRHVMDVVLEEVGVDPLLEVVWFAGEAREQVDLVRHVGDAVGVEAQVQVRVEEVRREQPLELGLVDLRRRDRVLGMRLPPAIDDMRRRSLREGAFKSGAPPSSVEGDERDVGRGLCRFDRSERLVS